MGQIAGIHDLLLVTALLGAAMKALFGRDAFAATVFYIIFGLLLALVWAQLGAIDVGLAEASVGSGLTGALLLSAVRQFERDRMPQMARVSVARNLVVGALSCALSLAVFAAIWLQRDQNGGVLPEVRRHMAISGSTHPVTSVLLNFRAFDTWLELGVLALAAYGAVILRRLYGPKVLFSDEAFPYRQATTLARMMLPILVLVGGVMLWFGARNPGGAFQAGALIGAAGILLQLGGQMGALRGSLSSGSLMFRSTLVLGFSAFLLTAATTAVAGRNILQYPVDWAASCILIIEIAATLSIALTLNVMYAFSAPREGGAA